MEKEEDDALTTSHRLILRDRCVWNLEICGNPMVTRLGVCPGSSCCQDTGRIHMGPTAGQMTQGKFLSSGASIVMVLVHCVVNLCR